MTILTTEPGFLQKFVSFVSWSRSKKVFFPCNRRGLYERTRSMSIQPYFCIYLFNIRFIYFLTNGVKCWNIHHSANLKLWLFVSLDKLNFSVPFLRNRHWGEAGKFFVVLSLSYLISCTFGDTYWQTQRGEVCWKMVISSEHGYFAYIYTQKGPSLGGKKLSQGAEGAFGPHLYS